MYKKPQINQLRFDQILQTVTAILSYEKYQQTELSALDILSSILCKSPQL